MLVVGIVPVLLLTHDAMVFGCLPAPTASGLVDMSVASSAAAEGSPAMLAHHAAWKTNPPYIRVMMMCLALILPVALFQMVTEDVIGLLMRGPITRTRHALGCIALSTWWRDSS